MILKTILVEIVHDGRAIHSLAVVGGGGLLLEECGI